MKKMFLAVAVVTAMVSLAYAGVNGIRSNGNISGVPSYQVSCSSGNTVIIYKKNGTWYKGSSGHMGNKYDSWSTEDVAEFVCR